MGIEIEISHSRPFRCHSATCEGIGVLVPQADGAGNDLLVGRYLQLGLFFYSILTIPGVIIWALFTENAVRWFGFDDDTAIMGQEYAYTLLIYLFVEGILECFIDFLNTLDHENYATVFTIVACITESVAIIILGVLGVKDLVVVGLVQVAVGCLAMVVNMIIIVRRGWLERYWEGILRTNGLKDRRAMHTVFITALPLGLAWLLTFGEVRLCRAHDKFALFDCTSFVSQNEKCL
jgi:Na+-driven multidrug efflux pump